MREIRVTTQGQAPSHAPEETPGAYHLFPSHRLPEGNIDLGYDALAAQLPERGRVAIDGFAGIAWEEFRRLLGEALRRRLSGPVRWVDLSTAWKSETELTELLADFLGGEDPLFGRRYTGTLLDFLDPVRLQECGTGGLGELVIVYGCGAGLAVPDGFLVYVDLPKNEVQYRARGGMPTNLGLREALPAKAAYKRAYFVDWPVLNAHKKALAWRVDLVVDGQRTALPGVVSGEHLRNGLAHLARHAFRVRPWFEPGAWGGQWCRRYIRALPPAANYAWSFELIAPENGLLFRDWAGRLLEVSFDWLMFRHGPEVLGECATWFGDEFPIRFDFLDTVQGGNLSVQVHPGPEYIRSHFGERFTQDEAYYILRANSDAVVNLGFREGTDPAEFHSALEQSQRDATPLDMSRYVQALPSKRDDFFLIPHGTIHGAGAGNLVLEISATPYIFTFKLYDWLRPDLDGRPRPLNIERGMECLDFSRSGAEVESKLISRPVEVDRGYDWVKEHLPTHPDHFYEVFRFRFRRELEIANDWSVHIHSLVSGRRVEVDTGAGEKRVYSHAETFVVPSATGRYLLRSLDGDETVVVLARMKRPVDWPEWMKDLTPR